MTPLRDPAAPRGQTARWRLAGAVLLLLSLVACSSGSDPVLDAPRRLEFSLVDPAPRDSSVIQSLEFPSDLSAWKIEGMGEARVRPRRNPDGSEGAPVLRLRGDASADTRIAIRGEFDARSFNRLAIRASSARDVYVGAVFYRDGKIRASSDARLRIPGRMNSEKAPSDTPDLVILRLPDTRLLDETFSRMLLIFEGGTPALDIHSIDVMHEPVVSWLPDAAGEPRLVAIGEDQRRAVGLSGRSKLEFEFRAPKDALLSLSCGLPVDMRHGGPPPVVELLLNGANGHEERREIRLDALRSKAVKWHDWVVPMTDFGGKTVRASVHFANREDPIERACAVTEPILTRPGGTAPTVLLVTSDTHRADHVAVSRLGVEITTPRIDALAEQGLYFERCFATTNVTNPSHVAIMTAVSPRDSGVVDNLSTLGDAAPTLAEAFREQGWMTFGSVSLRAMGAVERNIGQGFDRFGAPVDPVRSANATISQLREWLPVAGGQPLFVWLHLYDAHAPYDPPAEFQDQYYPPGRDPYDTSLPLPDIPEGILQPWAEGLRDLEFPNAQYRAEISYLDRELGALLDEPRFGEAVIAITSDHGESLGDTPIYWDHAELYPANLHVPLILTWPGAPQGERVEKTVINHHLGRTLLDLAGLDEVEFGGESLLASLDPGFPEDQPRFVLSANATSASLTRGNWHLVLHLRRHWRDIMKALDPAPRHLTELFNLAADPNCLRDVAAQEPERTREMRELLISWLRDADDRGWSAGASQDADLLREIAQLGYATSIRSETELWPDECDCRYCRDY